MDLLNYLPEALAAGFATLITWVGRDHFQEDDNRFKYMADSIRDVNIKLDSAVKQASDNHSEVLRLLIQPIRDRKIDE